LCSCWNIIGIFTLVYFGKGPLDRPMDQITGNVAISKGKPEKIGYEK
jgi:hypothetical protein